MNNLKIFENEEFGQIRTVQLNNEIYFVGIDLANALKYQNGSRDINRHVDEEDRAKTMVFDGNQNKETIIINESGMFSMILGSKLESAKRFKHWVTSEVLPSIRKTGAYQKQSIPEQIKTIAIGYTELEEKVDTVNEDLQNFKQDMPILGIEESRITAAVKKKGVQCLGGKESEAYQDKSLRGKVYADIYGQLKRQFGVATYKAIKRNQCDSAVSVVENYKLPIVLAEQIEDCNAQITF